VLFVNVPVGVAAALAVPRVLLESGPTRVPGAITGTGGIATLLCGPAQPRHRPRPGSPARAPDLTPSTERSLA
jgi:hypothetical protein